MIHVALCLGLLFAQDTLTVLHVNDTHSHIGSFGPKDGDLIGSLGGMDRLSTLLSDLRSNEPNTMFLHAGDVFLGDFMFNEFLGTAELILLRELDCDAFCIGNHEFDLGPEQLASTLDEAGLPSAEFAVLSGNLDLSGCPELQSHIEAYRILERGSLTVGVLGLTTTETNFLSNPSPAEITDPIQAANTLMEALRETCDVVIVLSHLGLPGDSLLAIHVSGIDLIVGGHTENILEDPVYVSNPEGEPTIIVQAGDSYRYLGMVRLLVSEGNVDLLTYELIPVDSTVPSDPHMSETIDSLKSIVEADPLFGPVYSEVVSECDTLISMTPPPGPFMDTGIGNLVTDAIRASAGVQIAVEAAGVIRQDLYPGYVARADLYQCVPTYDPATGQSLPLVDMGLLGIQILIVLEGILTEYNVVPQVSGMSYAFDSEGDPYNKLITDSVRVNGELIESFSIYSIGAISLLSDLLVEAGIPPLYVDSTGITEYDALVSYATMHSPIRSAPEGRIIDIALSDIAEERRTLDPERVLRITPNPMTGDGTVSFTLARPGHLNLEIADVLGRFVVRASLPVFPEGNHVIDLGPYLLGLRSGVYFLHLVNPEGFRTSTIVLTR